MLFAYSPILFFTILPYHLSSELYHLLVEVSKYLFASPSVIITTSVAIAWLSGLIYSYAYLSAFAVHVPGPKLGRPFL